MAESVTTRVNHANCMRYQANRCPGGVVRHGDSACMSSEKVIVAGPNIRAYRARDSTLLGSVISVKLGHRHNCWFYDQNKENRCAFLAQILPKRWRCLGDVDTDLLQSSPLVRSLIWPESIRLLPARILEG